MVGHRIGTYTVTGALGRGGFGEVLAAVHDVLGRDVAIKVLHTRWCDDVEAVRRFVAEARAVNAVRHPNIVDVVDFGTLDDGRHYHVMERLRGESLHARLAARGRLSLAEAVPILGSIAAALDAAHAAGIVHRDVKPENVFLHRDGDVEIAKLIDFGLAKLITPTTDGPTQSGVILGTPAYMAPEQCRGAAIDRATDAYAFGVVAYEVLTGTVPLRGADPVATLLAQVHDEPEPLSRRCDAVPAGVDAIVMPLLAKAAAQRPSRLSPVIARLAAIVDDPDAEPAARSGAGRWWLGGAAIIAAAVTVVIAAGRSGPRAENHGTPVVTPTAPDRSAAPQVAPADAMPAAAIVPDAAARPAGRGGGRPRPNPEDPENPYATP